MGGHLSDLFFSLFASDISGLLCIGIFGRG